MGFIGKTIKRGVTSNHSIQKVDFDHLSIIHQQGRLLEENHYYPYGMLIEGLSYISNRNNPSKYKFNGISYETSNDLYNYMAPFRSYDPSIAKWNQLDPMNQFENGYFAFGGNPVNLIDPLGLSASYGQSRSDFASMDAITQMRDNKGRNGGGPGNWFTGGDGFLSADGTRYSSEELRSFFENMRFYNSLPDEVKDALGTGAAGFAGGIHNGDISVDSYSYEPVVAHYSQYKQGDFVSQLTFSGYDYGRVHRTSGNVVAQSNGGGLSSPRDFANELKYYYKYNSGTDYHLSPERFNDVYNQAHQNNAIQWNKATRLANGNYSIPVNFYKTDYDFAFGRATMYFSFDKTNGFQPTGFYDLWNLDPKAWGTRSTTNEIITRYYNWQLNGGTPFKVTYP